MKLLKYTKRRNMVSRKSKKSKKSKNRKRNKKGSLRKKYYQKGGMDTASADLEPPAYRDSYDEEIYSKLNK